MDKKHITLIIIVLIIILAIGVIGGIEASKIGTTCDFDLGDSLCWKWHKNNIGQIGDAFSNLGNR